MICGTKTEPTPPRAEENLALRSLESTLTRMTFEESLYAEIFRSPHEQRVPVEIVSTGPLKIEAGQMAEFLVPLAQDRGFVPLSSGEKVQPVSSWKELEDQLEIWMARSGSGITYLRASFEASGPQSMTFRPGADLQLREVGPAPVEYSRGPASSLASTSLNQ